MDSRTPPLVNLEQGELYIGIRPAEVRTVLGSCVSITLYHPRLRVGTICHSRLAERACDQPLCGLKICRNLGDYVTCSVMFMLSYFEHHGATRQELVVKLFGGANMFNLQKNDEALIGRRNVNAAMALIRRERLHLLATDVGGGASRLLTFHTATGEVLLKRNKIGLSPASEPPSPS
ncbi:MAG: chemotaxis protein CheD [Magnetococcales bacterium]|nr:chemotaxis protein CheD [Magnetococcales bacterium]